jgi:Uma2 family endonuclease
MSAVTPQLMTAEEFWVLPDSGRPRALVRGEVVETMPPGGVHGAIAIILGALLRAWAKVGGHGVVGAEAGFILARDPDIVRGPDISFVRADRVPSTGIPEAFWEQAPDLVVEIVSPSETAEAVREKVRDFLAAGTPLVWVVYPRSREVLVHRPNGSIQALTEGDTLEGATVLPGFACRVGELFE